MKKLKYSRQTNSKTIRGSWNRFSVSPEYKLFWNRLVKHPKKLGAVLPSSKALADFIGKIVASSNNSFVVEIGSGTGRLTQGIIESGVPLDKIACVDIDHDLCHFLKQIYPGLQIFEGCAQNLENLLPDHWIGNVGTIVSGIPMMNLPSKIRDGILSASLPILSPGGRFVQFTYGMIAPISSKVPGFSRKHIGCVWRNFPPASIWVYEKI